MAIKEKIVVNPAYRCAESIVRRVTSGGLPPESVLIYDGRRNKLAKINCIDGPGDNSAGMEVNVKSFRIPPFPNNYIYRFFRPGKARRSYENALRLIEMGFRTPVPLGYSECRRGLRLFGNHGLWITLSNSYYFCEQVPFGNFHYWEFRDDVEALMTAFAAEIARLHKAGIWFRDFSPGNILIDRTPEGEYEFYYVDLNRMDFGVTDESKLMQMFKSITFCDEWVEKLARAYALAAGKDVGSTVAKAIEARHSFTDRHNVKERLKRLIGLSRDKQAGKK